MHVIKLMDSRVKVFADHQNSAKINKLFIG